MKLNDLFDCVYYINLDYRKDRNDKFWQLNNKFLDENRTVRISAIDGRNTKHNTHFESIINARSAISASYIKPFLHALENNFNEILIFEDDAEPLNLEIQEIKDNLSSANQAGYEILFLGGTVQSKLNKTSSNLFELKGNILATQSVCYNNRNNLFNEFSAMPKDIDRMRAFLLKNGGYCMDTIIGSYFTKIKKSFLSSRLLFGQYESHSDIEAKTTKYNADMQSRFEKYSRHLC